MKQCDLTKCDQFVYLVKINSLHLSNKMRLSTKTLHLALAILSIILIDSVLKVQGLFEPYKVLGVHRRASLSDIRKAYKQLAKEWHPDKVSGGQEKKAGAEAKFIEINRAYELLRYVYGTTGV